MRSDADIEEAIDRYGDTVLRACCAYLSYHDAEDAFQDTFIKYAAHDAAFNDETHRKAWLIRVGVNLCKDKLRKASMREVSLNESADIPTKSEDGAIADRLRIRHAMQQLSDDQRLAVMLSVVEGYSVPEIAQVMDKPQNTVYSHLTRGKKKLKKVLGHDGL